MFRRLTDAVFHFTRGIRRAFYEIVYFFGQLLWFFDPRQWPRLMARSSREAFAGGRTVAATTTFTLADVLIRIVRAPLDFGRWLCVAPFRFWFYMRSRTPIQLLAGIIVLCVGTVAVAWPVYTIRRDRNQETLRREQYRQLDIHCQRGDLDSARHNMQVIVEITPNDEKAAARLEALNAGASMPGDSKMARLFMLYNLSRNNAAGAADEARKYLEMVPSDWESLIVVAEEALRSGDRTAAAAAVARLPMPTDPAEGIALWSCVSAEEVFRQLHEHDRLNSLIDYVADKCVPILRSIFFDRMEPPLRLQFVQLYNLAMLHLAQHPELKTYWAKVQEVCHGVANAPKLTTYDIIRLGAFQEQHLSPFLGQMQQLNMIGPDEARDFAKEIEDRLAGLWKRLRAMDSKEPVGYIGPAMQLARAGKLTEAVQEIDAGLVACGPQPRLIEKKTELLRLVQPAESLAFLERSLDQKDLTPQMCQVIAQASLAAGRPDKALAAIRRAQQLAPEQLWAHRLEGEALLQAGRPTEAAAALRKVLTSVGLDLPACSLYVRALSEAGAPGLAEQFLIESTRAPEKHIAVLYGADTLIKLKHAQSAIAVLQQMIREAPNSVPAHILLGDAIRALAEQEPHGWNREMVGDALKAYRDAMARKPQLPVAIERIAWLELIALEVPLVAEETIKPLRASNDPLPPPMLATIGAVDVGMGRFEDGRRRLELALRYTMPTQATGASIGVESQFGSQVAAYEVNRVALMAYLAWAYLGLNQTQKAEDCIKQASAMSKSSPRDAELIAKVQQRIAQGRK